MTVTLTWHHDGNRGVWTGDLPITIGRSERADVTVDVDQLSRTHARLDADGDGFALTDLDSSNGTLVDGDRVERASLKSPAEFELGPVQFEALRVDAPEEESGAEENDEPPAGAETVLLSSAPEPPEVSEVEEVPEDEGDVSNEDAPSEDAPSSLEATSETPPLPTPVDAPSGTSAEPAEEPEATATPETMQTGPMTSPATAPPEPPPPTGITVAWLHTETGETGETTAAPPVVLGSRAECTVRLDAPRVSRRHAEIVRDGDRVILRDTDSSNGTYVDGERITQTDLGEGGVFEIRPFRLSATLEGAPPLALQDADPEATQLVDADATVLEPMPPPPASDAREPVPPAEADDEEAASILFDDEGAFAAAPPPPDRGFPPPAFDADVVSLQALRASGLPLEETAYLAIGGGIGSFVWVDNLRIYGVPAGDIRVVGLEEKPYGRYERLCKQSQIPDHERLRSDSGSTPDCIWGWPGYAVREAWEETKKGGLGLAGRAVWKIFGEPTLATTYTPRSVVVFRAMDREGARIGWDRMWQRGRVKSIRKTDDGRYVAAFTVPGATQDRHRLVVGKHLHIAVGYPGIRLLPDLQEYRISTGDTRRVVNAYEEHEHVYEHLARHGGTVLLRGWGIVASRIVQRVYELRQAGAEIGLLHLTRRIVSEGNRYRKSQREVDNNWEFQPFNWPKACWGGDLRFKLEGASNEERAELLGVWGGTTTADREDWRRMVDEGVREGWYVIREGEVDHVEPNGDTVRTVIVGKKTFKDETQLDADFIMDCTGLESGIDSHPLLKDLVEHHGLGRNVQRRLDVADDFELRGMRSGEGRAYAAGGITLGGPYAPVDSFLGLQYSAQRSVDALVRARAPHLVHLTPSRSLKQWRRWSKGVPPEGR